MRLLSPWQPWLAAIPAPPSDRLAAALADDILSGVLPAAARLPPQRELAFQMKIGLGTVTKAFAILERRGLVRSVKGRGSFVAALEARSGPEIDLSVNAPPRMLGERLLAQTLTAIARQIDPDLFTGYPPSGGHEAHRRPMAQWLAALGMVAEPERIILCNGAHQGLGMAFAVASRPGGTIFTEALTYPGAIALARHAGYRLVGVAMDHQGIRADALERALEMAPDTGPLVLYLTPTMQNPTTATMRLARRQDIVRLCRYYDVRIVEDDVYALSAAEDRPPIAMLAPERSFYVNSLSKTVSPGLRVGVLVVPRDFVAPAKSVLRAASLMVSPLSCALMERWIGDGTAEAIRAAIRVEARHRRAIAMEALGSALRPTDDDGFHLFIPLQRVAAERLHDAASMAGVRLTPPAAIAVDPAGEDSGIRLCLGGPSMAELKQALGVLAGLLPRLQVTASPTFA